MAPNRASLVRHPRTRRPHAPISGAEKRLRWVSHFANDQLPTDRVLLPTLAVEATRFCAGGAKLVEPRSLKRLKWEAQRFLKGTYNAVNSGVPFTCEDTRQRRFHLAADGDRLMILPSDGDDIRTIFSGALGDLLLGLSTLAKLHRCERRGCGRIFYEVRRQRHCSPACAPTARQRTERTKVRTEQYRARLDQWESRGAQPLNELLRDARRIQSKRRPVKYKTVAQLVAGGQEAVAQAQRQLLKSFPRRRGRHFKAARNLLSDTERVVKRFDRKR